METLLLQLNFDMIEQEKLNDIYDKNDKNDFLGALPFI